MSRFILFFCLFFGTAFTLVRAQETTPELNETEKLWATAKVWGFLKYYHPKVAKGQTNWDEALLQTLPKIKSSKTKETFSTELLNWIKSLGKVPKCKTCAKKNRQAAFEKNFDLTWTQNDRLFTPELQKALSYIEHNRWLGKQHYVASQKYVGNIKVTNEPEYADFDWENENMRLLTLFRYWNIVEYFFPYKYQMDQLWDQTLRQQIPEVSRATSELDFHLSLLKTVVQIDDSHGKFSTPTLDQYFGKYWFPTRFNILKENQFIISNAYNDSLATANNLRAGDRIIAINDKPIDALFRVQSTYIRGSNASVKKRNAFFYLLNGSTSTVQTTILRNTDTLHLTVNRYLFDDLGYKKKSVKKWKILANNIGYVHMGAIEKEDVPAAMEALSQTKAIIFDIRNYPKNTLYTIAGYLTNAPKPFVKVLAPDLSYPGKYKWTSTLKCGKNNGVSYNGKVVLLVNSFTQSHAEFTCMCLEAAANVTIIGSQTAGADGNVSRFQMANNQQTVITGIGIFYPDGRPTQRVGIVPDIEVVPTQKGIANGEDEVLLRALRFLKEQ